MTFIAGLHGTIAAILICSLLYVDEAGLPLPIAPNEGLLLVTGLLIAGGAFPLYAIFPAAYLAMAAGMLTGYGWARGVGQGGLQSLAERARAGKAYERARARLQTAGPWSIAAARLIPGLRPYATLISGAAEVDITTFSLGAFPALLLWEIVWIAAGILIGLPLADLLSRFEKLLARGVILVGLGVVSWLAVRNTAADERGGVARLAPRFRATLALTVDAGIALSVVSGLFAIGRRILEITTDAWIEVIVAAFLLAAILIFGRTNQTPGETLFDTNYWHHHREKQAKAGDVA